MRLMALRGPWPNREGEMEMVIIAGALLVVVLVATGVIVSIMRLIW